MTLALLRYQLVAMFLDMLAWKIAFLRFLTPCARFFPEPQRHCAAQHPRGELVNDAGTSAVPTFCNVSHILAWEMRFLMCLTRPAPDFFQDLNATARRNTRAAN